MPTEIISPRDNLLGLRPPSRIKLDEAFGIGAGTELGDKSRYRSHGAIVTATWADGLHGRCLDFVAANPDYVEIPATHTQLAFTDEDFSIIARVYPDSIANNPYIFVKASWNASGYYLRILGTGVIRSMTFQAAANQQTDSAPGDIVAGAWYTIGLSRIGGAITLFKNGVDVTAIPAVHINPVLCGRTAKIGIWDDLAGAPLDGRIEFLRIFGGIALSAPEHLAWHRALA